jgi:lipopolysaccharide transport system permease protein
VSKEPALARAAVPAEAPEKPVREIVVTSRNAGLSTAALAELWEYREVFWAFVKRHLKVKYKQAALGFAWAVFQPLMSTLLIVILISRIAHLQTENLPSLPFVLCPMVLWTFFSSSVTFGMDSLVREQGLLRKIYFPREVLPMSSVLSFLVDLSPNLVVLLAVILLTHVGLHWTLLLASLPIALMVLVAVTVAMAASALNVYYRDVRQIIPFLIQLGLILNPVLWSVRFGLRSTRVREAYLIANPIGSAMDTFRRVALHGLMPDWPTFLISSAWAIALFLAAYALFKRIERNFVDRV